MQKLEQRNTQIGYMIDKKAKEGITLIALMITVIILLILAGVTLRLTLRRKRSI